MTLPQAYGILVAMGKDKRRIIAGLIRERGARYLKQLEEVMRGGPFSARFTVADRPSAARRRLEAARVRPISLR